MARLAEKRSEALETLDEWQKLISHFEITDHSFAYFPLLVPDSSWAEVCQNNLADYLTKNGKKLHVLSFDNPEDFKLLATRIFNETYEPNTEAVWIVTPIPFDKTELEIWKQAWGEAVARINQFRNKLTKNYPYTFLFVGGNWTQEITFNIAPDLWSIHTSVIRIEPPVLEREQDEDDEKILITLASEKGKETDPNFALKEANRLQARNGSELTIAALFHRAAEGFLAKGDLSKAQETVNAAIEIYRQNKSEVELADALMTQGNILFDLSETNDALIKYQEAVVIYEKLNITYNLAAAYSNIGIILSNVGRPHEAINESEKAIVIYQKLVYDERRNEFANDLGSAYMNEGVSLTNLGKLKEAITKYDRAIATFEEFARQEKSKDWGRTYLNKGIALRRLGRLNEADYLFDQANQAYQELINKEKGSQMTLKDDLELLNQNREDVRKLLKDETEEKEKSKWALIGSILGILLVPVVFGIIFLIIWLILLIINFLFGYKSVLDK